MASQAIDELVGIDDELLLAEMIGQDQGNKFYNFSGYDTCLH